jgi:hypothetical protein
MTLDSTAEDRMSFDGKGARIIFIAVIWGRRRFIYRFGFASEGNEGPSGAVTPTLAGRGNSAIG